MKTCRTLALALALAAPAFGDDPSPRREPGIDQLLGASVSLDVRLRDERGQPVTLGEASCGKPFVLALVYYRCPMLCNLILNGVLESLVDLAPTAGDQFQVVTVSFDPAEGPELAAAKKAHYLKAYGRAPAERGWRFLTGEAGAVERLCREAGFRVSYDPATRQYAHASAILVLTPEGRISRYFMGIAYPPRDLRLALVEASAGKIGTAADRLLLLCLQYDPASGKYTLAVWKLLRGASALTLIALAVLLVRLSRRRAPAPAATPTGPGLPGRA